MRRGKRANSERLTFTRTLHSSSRPLSHAPTNLISVEAPDTMAPQIAQPAQPPMPPVDSNGFDDEGPFLRELKKALGCLAARAVEDRADAFQEHAGHKDQQWQAYVEHSASTPWALLERVCFGNVQLAVKQGDQGILDALAYTNGGAAFAPGICLWELVHKITREAPSADILLKILDIAHEYFHGRNDGRAFEIDSLHYRTWTKFRSKRGERFYTQNDRYQHVAKRVDEFDKLERRMKDVWSTWTAAEKALPMTQPIREAVYAKECWEHIEQYKRYGSSNYLTSLFDSICTLYPQEIGGTFGIESAIIYLMGRPDEASTAKQFFTTIARADTSAGRGFSHEDAGISVSSADHANIDWAKASLYVMKESRLIENMAAEKKRLEELQKMDMEIAVAKKEVEVLEQMRDDQRARKLALSQPTPQGDISDIEDKVEAGEKALKSAIASADKTREDMEKLLANIRKVKANKAARKAARESAAAAAAEAEAAKAVKTSTSPQA